MLKYLAFSFWHVFAVRLDEKYSERDNECISKNEYCYEFQIDKNDICMCPSNEEIECDEEGGWWH